MKTNYYIEHYEKSDRVVLMKVGWFWNKKVKEFSNMDKCIDFLYDLSIKLKKELQVNLKLIEGK